MPHPVFRLRQWRAGPGGYEEIDPHLAGAPSDEDLARLGCVCKRAHGLVAAIRAYGLGACPAVIDWPRFELAGDRVMRQLRVLVARAA